MSLDPVATNPDHYGWLPAQQHAGENIGDTETHVLFVELEQGGTGTGDGSLGPR